MQEGINSEVRLDATTITVVLFLSVWSFLMFCVGFTTANFLNKGKVYIENYQTIEPDAMAALDRGFKGKK